MNKIAERQHLPLCNSFFHMSAKFIIFFWLFASSVLGQQIQLKIYLTGNDCYRHLQHLSDMNTLHDSIPITIYLPKHDFFVGKQIIEKNGVAKDKQVEFDSVDYRQNMKTITSTYCELVVNDSLLKEFKLDDFSTAAEIANFIYSSYCLKDQRLEFNEPWSSSDVLIRSDTCILHIADRSLNTYRLIDYCQKTHSKIYSIDSLIISEFKAHRWDTSEFTPYGQFGTENIKPVVSISSTALINDKFLIIGTAYLDFNHNDNYYDDFTGYLISISDNADFQLSVIENLEDIEFNQHRIQTRSGCALIDSALVFNLMGDTCTDTNRFFAAYSYDNNNLKFIRYIEPSLPDFDIGGSNCYSFRELLIKDDIGMLRIYPGLFNIKKGLSFDLFNALSEIGYAPEPMKSFSTLMIHDFYLHPNNLISVIFRWKHKYLYSLISISQNKALYHKEIAQYDDTEKSIFFTKDGIMSLHQNGSTLYQGIYSVK